MAELHHIDATSPWGFFFSLCLVGGCVDNGDANLPSSNERVVKEVSGVRANYQIKNVPIPHGVWPPEKMAGNIAQVNHDVVTDQ